MLPHLLLAGKANIRSTNGVSPNKVQYTCVLLSTSSKGLHKDTVAWTSSYFASSLISVHQNEITSINDG